MNITVLTTETSHHRYFVRELAATYSSVHVVCEQSSAQSKADTLDRIRDDYEKQLWFGGVDTTLEDMAETRYYANINSSESLETISSFAPDVIIVFGTGKIGEELINKYTGCLFNLHGGNPQRYRGLDSHLWTIFNRDWVNLVTTMHRIEPEFDTGEIYQSLPLKFSNSDELYMLRAVNTGVCITLSKNLLQDFERDTLTTFPQSTRGEYFSSMPASCKEQCITFFREYTRTL